MKKGASARTLYFHDDAHGTELVLTRGCGHEYPPHFHLRHSIAGFVGCGDLFLSLNGVERHLAAGSCFTIPARVVHGLRLAAATVLLTVCVKPGRTDMEKLFRQIVACEAPFFEGWLPKQEHSALKAALHAARALSAASKATTLSGPVKRVADRLQKMPEETFSLSSLAASAGYTPWHFLRLFQREAGLAPHAYQICCRLRLARFLLREGRRTADVAACAGFFDQSHLHRIFRRHHGLTPSEFRRSSNRLGL